MSKVDIIKNPLIQSGYTYLQAAGSDGTDKTALGRHLRWDLLRTLGDNHIPKGDYTLQAPYESKNGFDREKDFVKIYRSEFTEKKFFVKINFQALPTKENKTATTREWFYTLQVNGLTGVTTDVVVRFMDIAQYDAIRATQTTLNTLNLLAAYTGIVEVEPQTKLSFYFEFTLKINRANGKNPAGYLRNESVCIPDTIEPATKQVNCRKKFTPTNTSNSAKIICENIQYIRFDYVNTELKELDIITYVDYIAGVNAQGTPGGWLLIGDFALTTDDTLMSTRFMKPEVDGAIGHWPKFNDSNSATGEFCVNANNYRNRWRRPGFTFDPINTANNDVYGLQNAIHTYMLKSVTDPKAIVSLPSVDPSDPDVQTLSFLDMLKLVSLDFHVARVLGLGHIDKAKNQGDKIPYIYCLEYKTFAELEAPLNKADERTHVYMTIPTSINDYRLPAKPTLTPLTYGITVDNGTGQPTNLTDANGYAPFGNVRFININRAPFNFEKPFGPFYWDTTEFCLCDETQPIGYGVEYKEISEAIYRKPELSNDTEYFDNSGLPETMPIIERGKPTIYLHQETEEGSHIYGSYSINWFSRVSPVSNTQQADTVFPKQSHLLPPFNLAVQLIQDEDPTETNIADKTLILTTPSEQQRLLNLTNSDKTLVRTSFDWNYVHHHAHQYADYAELFFRRNEPLVVKGQVLSVNSLPNNRAQITTGSYVATSTSPATTVSPIIASADSQKFVGALFSAGQNNYIIESVISNGANPTFIIQKIKQVQAAAPNSNNQNQFISVETYVSPSVGDLFFSIENMSALSNWDLKHSRKVYLEKFYSNSKIGIRFSPTRIVYHDIKQLNFASGNTEIVVEKPINLNTTAGVSAEYVIKRRLALVGTGQFSIQGNFTTDLTVGKTFRIFGSKNNDAVYTVTSSSFVAGRTIINVSTAIPDVSTTTGQYGVLEFIVNRSMLSINATNNSITIANDVRPEIDLAHLEYRLETDGSTTRYVVGGINDTVTLEPILFAQPLPPTTPPTVPAPFQMVANGFIRVKFDNYTLLPHVDKEIDWYKGIVRLTDVGGNVQPYPVTLIETIGGVPVSPLSIIIQDPGFIPDTGTGNTFTLDVGHHNSNNANYHPSYKLYIETDAGLNPVNGTQIPSSGINFDSTEILPALSNPNEGNRYTYMAIRSYDIKNDLDSYISTPVVLLAQKITIPVKPGQPQGPLYATRPDFYGKSTYTFDTELMDTAGGRIPYSVVFYRSSEDRILDVLYRKSTQEQIWQQLNALPGKTKYDPNLWKILFEADNSPNDGSVDSSLIPNDGKHPAPSVGFRTYSVLVDSNHVQFTWPLPDNDGNMAILPLTPTAIEKTEYYRGGFVFPYEATNVPTSVFRPFQCAAGTGLPLFNLSISYNVYGKSMSAKDILKKAIQSVFLPMSEQPPLYNYIKAGIQTSPEKVKPRDTNGNLIDPMTHDLFPMIRKLPNLSTPLGNLQVRFTDYTLDGASKSLYFYLGLEMSDKFKFSEAGLPVGPVLLVNAMPAEKPQVRKVTTVLQNAITNTPTSVLFNINEYLPNDKISKIEIYRAYNELDAKSIRTMVKAKSYNFGDALIDDFSDLQFPAYGEKLHYRLVAIRQIEDVEDVVLAPQVGTNPIPTKITDAPSRPSDLAFATVVDTINPQPPHLYSINGISTPTILQDVVLKWDPTCFNGTYYLQKLNASGNWVEIFREKVKDTNMQYPPLDGANNPDFTNFPETASLDRVDENGNQIYHRFRVQVENSSGLFNLTEYEITLAKGASDLQEMPSQLSFADGNLHSLSVLNNFDIVTGASQPNSLTFTHLDNLLPAGHNSFTSLDITVTDDLNNTQTLSITSAGASVTFDATSAPTLDLTNPNRKYTVKTKLFTDFATNGAVQIFTINYLSGPAYDLKQITSLVKLTDSNHDVNPLISGNINNGVAYPTQLQFTKIVDLSSINQTFNYMDIVVTDDLGNTATKTIATAGTDVTFTSADGLMLDNTNPNRSYEIKAKIFTDEAPLGNEITYNISYTYTPCDDITTLTGIAKFTDNNGTTINPIANQTITAVTHPNGSITLQDLISAALPSGHTFNHMDVILEDDLGGAFIKTINAASGTVTFNNGDGGLVLDNSNPHRTYFVTAVLYTNLCSNGASYSFTIKY